jgi:hypothetical protein
VVISVFRAWFGVQTEENRQRDFSSNDPTPFIVAGIIFTLVMIVGVIIAVKMALWHLNKKAPHATGLFHSHQGSPATTLFGITTKGAAEAAPTSATPIDQYCLQPPTQTIHQLVLLHITHHIHIRFFALAQSGTHHWF